LQPAIRDTNLLEHTVHSVHFRAVEVGFKKPRFLGFKKNLKNRKSSANVGF